ncbi:MULTISPECIES: DUF1697 domain-containing protein [Rhizobium]|uniref:Uncharacterized protein (DUF1697 family) n=1 Tax=Rhizobium paranaense TaxID=1650438 RepID=A0A7W8XM09_9HYPH|nr:MULTISPECIES: DUF1697 domain-containing protein [Rhizobium]MBB5571867.1 uncharacterized protein (DUF1697 family) [Rhizobium paranaense]PST63927.1 hypothetical protein C9E91_06215 [Rhizobium sp. SEMIA4064]
MPVYVALLRAVNVGGTGALPMAELKAVCEEIGFTDVKTYIQSGNVLFRSDRDEAAVQKDLEAALARKMGTSPGVLLRSRQELQAIADGSPFPHAKPNYLLVNFLPEPAPADALEKLVAPGGEEVHVAGREIYVHYPDGSGRSKLRLPALKAGTSRNLNTVRKLAEMAREMEAG